MTTKKIDAAAAADAESKQTSTKMSAQTFDFDMMELQMVKKMKESGKCFHYKARAELFPDVVRAFHILLDSHFGEFKVIRPIIKGSMMGDVEFDFWTCSTIEELQKVWDEEGTDLHRIIQTIKPFESYTGERDNSYWENKKKSATE